MWCRVNESIPFGELQTRKASPVQTEEVDEKWELPVSEEEKATFSDSGIPFSIHPNRRYGREGVADPNLEEMEVNCRREPQPEAEGVY